MKMRPLIYLIIFLIPLSFTACLEDPPEATGTFIVQFSGDKTNEYQGQAYFNLNPSNSNGLITVRLDISNVSYMRLTFFNPDPNQIFLEPGTYTIVERLSQNLTGEVLFDYVDETGLQNAESGQVSVGIVKNSQIKGNILNASFSSLNSTCTGDFDAIPE